MYAIIESKKSKEHWHKTIIKFIDSVEAFESNVFPLVDKLGIKYGFDNPLTVLDGKTLQDIELDTTFDYGYYLISSPNEGNANTKVYDKLQLVLKFAQVVPGYFGIWNVDECKINIVRTWELVKIDPLLSSQLEATKEQETFKNDSPSSLSTLLHASNIIENITLDKICKRGNNVLIISPAYGEKTNLPCELYDMFHQKELKDIHEFEKDAPCPLKSAVINFMHSGQQYQKICENTKTLSSLDKPQCAKHLLDPEYACMIVENYWRSIIFLDEFDDALDKTLDDNSDKFVIVTIQNFTGFPKEKLKRFNFIFFVSDSTFGLDFERTYQFCQDMFASMNEFQFVFQKVSEIAEDKDNDASNGQNMLVVENAENDKVHLYVYATRKHN